MPKKTPIDTGVCAWNYVIVAKIKNKLAWPE